MGQALNAGSYSDVLVCCLQRLIFISLIGRFNRTMTRYLSVGHIFTVNILYAT